MTLVLWCDGTWSRGSARSAASEAVRRGIEALGWQFRYVDYPAKFGPVTGAGDISMEASVGVGVENLAAAVEATPETRVIVGGYSQGAIVAVRFVTDVLPHRDDLIVIGLATLGDPYSPVHDGRSGIAGARAVMNLPRFTYWAAGDPIGDLPLGSPMRGLADLGAWMSVRSPEDGKKWAADVAAKAAQRRLQSWWAPWRWADLASVGWYVGNYLGTAHTTDYISKGLVDKLVSDLARHYRV
ncbi:lysin B [Gordonia phage Ligma]|nr:lysin B [Gordonia phage Ligma]UQT02143.1 lysin B [Gordonia phage Axumite]